MAPEKATVIDGFTSVQALRRSGLASRDDRPHPAPAPPLPADKHTGEDLPPHLKIGHTAVPESHHIICYGCGYTFLMRGRLRDTFCPKCREALSASDLTIDSEWKADVQTTGTVEIKPGGSIVNASVVSGNLVLAGTIVNCSVRVCGTLELCHGAQLDLPTIEAQSLRIQAGARFSMKTLNCNRIEILGSLKTELFAEERVAVRDGGSLVGKVHTRNLEVDDGGRLSALLWIGEAGSPACDNPDLG